MTSQCGELKLLDKIEGYYNQNSIANILSLGSIADHCRTPTMDTDAEDVLLVHVCPDTTLRFVRCGHSLYYFDAPNPIPHIVPSKVNTDVTAYCFLITGQVVLQSL